MRTTIVDKRARVRRVLLLLIVAGGALLVLVSMPALPIHGLAPHATKSLEALPDTLTASGPPVQDHPLVAGGGAGRLPACAASAPAAVVRGFPTYPGASWNGDLTGQEADGQTIWLIGWTAPADEKSVQRFFMATLAHLNWDVVTGDDRHQVSLRHRVAPPLRGYLRFGPPEFGERGTGVTLGLRDPDRRHLDCAEAVAGLPIYPGATVRECDLTHTPGHVNFSLFLASSDASSFVWQSYTRLLVDAGWHSSGAIPGAQLMSDATGRTARLILGPDIAEQLETGMMLSVDLPKGSLTELPT
jgi:hypothetical protein